MNNRPRRGPIPAPPLDDDDVVSVPSSLNTSIGGAYSALDASPSFVRPQSKSLLRRGHNDEADRGGVSTAPRTKPVPPPPRRPSGPVGIAAPIDSYLLETQRNWGARIHPGQDLPHSDSDMASLDTSMVENETAGNVPSLKPRKGSGLPLSGGGGGGGVAGRAPYASPTTEARDVMPLMESVALLDAAIRRNQKLLSSGEMPFKPCSIDHKAGNGGGKNGAASKRCTGNDLKEQLLETLVITERAIDRHYSCPSDLKILAGIAKGGSGVRRQPHTGGDKQQQQGGGGASGFVWLQSPHALGPRNLNTVNNKPNPHTAGSQAQSSSAHVPQQHQPSRVVPPQRTGTKQQHQQPVGIALQRKVAPMVKHHTPSAELTEPSTPSAKPSSSAPVSTTVSGLQRRSHQQKESMPPHTPITAVQQPLPSVPSPLPVQPQQHVDEKEDDDDYDEPRLTL